MRSTRKAIDICHCTKGDWATNLIIGSQVSQMDDCLGYGKDSFLGEPFALLKSHMSFILYLCIIARQEEWELRQAYRAPVEEGAR